MIRRCRQQGPAATRGDTTEEHSTSGPAVCRSGGARARLHELRGQFWLRRLMFEARLYHRWHELKHRFGFHTFGELTHWDLDKGYLQYRGVRCLVCDEPPEW